MAAKTTISVREAKSQLPHILRLVEAGEEFTISRNGIPVARLVGVARRTPRVLGQGAGEAVLGEDFFDELPEDLLRAFEDGSEE